MIANIVELVVAFAGNIIALVVAFGNPAFSEIGLGVSVLSFILRTLALF
ncbi:MAG: hypothetical protein WD873_06530 [Candidatus Hydrogenedentales bacterium]